MKYIEQQLLKEKAKLEKCIERVTNRLDNVPDGRLYVRKKGKHIEYYYKKDKRNGKNIEMEGAGSKKNNKNGTYIRKDNKKLAKELAQRDYDISLLANAEDRIRAIESFLKKYKKTDISRVYHKTNQYRRMLLDDVILSDEEYVKRWESAEYKGKDFSDGFMEIFTDKGERVRSKSEKIIADKLNRMGIPYRYEYPLMLKDKVIIYPDFTLLNIDTKEEVYLEHCGLMDDQKYVDTMMFKLKSYEKNGIYLGINLFITYETSRYPFNGKMLEELMKNMFCCTKRNLLIE